MAIATSTIPAVKAALLARFRAALTDVPDEQITWGVPRGQLEREWVMIGDGADVAQTDAAVGQQRRDEVYTIDVIVSVVLGGLDTARAATERAFQIVAAMEGALRPLAAPPLGVTNLIAAVVSGTPFRERWDGENREAEVTVRIRCHARI